ncbi:MAG: iron-containing alcohol dehydrogenase [Pirellulales bacterium]
MRTVWTFESPGRLVFGPGAVEQVGLWAARSAWRRVFIVTDKALAGVGAVDRVIDSLSEFGIATAEFEGGRPEPTFNLVDGAVAAAHAFEPDAILGLGGGSNLDLAKITAAVYAHGGHAADYIGEDKVPGPVPPLICVPTTAGTGSEISCSCVLTDEAKHLKVSALSWHLRPRLAIVDPTLTLTCPRKVTADSGIDALVHAIEAYTTVDAKDFPLPDEEVSIYQGRNLVSDGFAERAIRQIGQHLRTAFHEPENLAARTGMALAATSAGIAFANSGLALVHALEYPLGGLVPVSHGAGNGLFLPHVMRYNLPARGKEYARIAEWLGVDISKVSMLSAAEQGIEKIVELQKELGIPTRLRDLGVREDQLVGLAEATLGIRRLIRLNPRQPTSDDVLKILEAAW